jgi:hypothetical protein
LVPKVFLVHKEHQVLQDNVDQQVHRVLLALWDHRVFEALKVPSVPLVPQDHEVFQVRLAHRVFQVQRVILVLLVV